MRRFTLALGIVLTSVGLFLSAPRATALAGPNDCDAVVLDTTSAHVLDQTAVQAASQKLANLGADVRVRAFQTAPSGGLDAYEANQIKSCASWRGPDGQTKGNLVVFLFSMDHQSAIFYGSNWHAGLDSNVDRIRSDYLNAQFKLGKFTDGVVQAEAQTQLVLNNQLHPSSSTSQSSSPHSSSAGKVFAWIGIVIGAILLIIAAGFGLVFARRRKQAREAARAEALKAREQTAQAMSALNADDVQRSYQIIISDLNDTDKAALQTAFGEAQTDYADAINADAARSDAGNRMNPERKFSTKQYQAMTAQFREITALAEQAHASLQAVENTCNKLMADITTAPDRAIKLEATYAKLQAQQNELTQAGYKQSSGVELDKIRSLLDEAKRQIDSKHHGQALDELNRADELCFSTSRQLDRLKTIRATLSQQNTDLTNAYKEATANLTAAESELNQLKANHDPSCIQDVSESYDKAQALVSTVDQNLTQAQQYNSMQSQQWDEAERLLAEAERGIAELKAFPGRVNDRKQQLKQLSSGLPVTINGLQSTIESARRELQGLKGSHDHARRELTNLLSQATSLMNELTQPKPAYFQISNAHEQLLEQAKQIRKHAKSEHDRIVAEERRRREEEEAAERRRRDSYTNAASFGAGYGIGSSFGGSSGGGFDSGGGSSGSWGGDSGGGSSGSW